MNTLLAFSGFTIAFVIVLYYERKIRRPEPKNKVHFYVARDKDNSLCLYLGKPERASCCFRPGVSGFYLEGKSRIREFGLNPNDFKYLTWEDEPVEVFINLKD